MYSETSIFSSLYIDFNVYMCIMQVCVFGFPSVKPGGNGSRGGRSAQGGRHRRCQQISQQIAWTQTVESEHGKH